MPVTKSAKLNQQTRKYILPHILYFVGCIALPTELLLLLYIDKLVRATD